MDFARVNRLCFCVLAFLASSSIVVECNAQSGVSASIQATATVISPVGLTESTSAPDNGWLLYAPDPGGVLIQVSVGGRVVEEFGPSDHKIVGDRITPSANPHISFVSCKRLAGAIQNDSLAMVVTVVYSDN